MFLTNDQPLHSLSQDNYFNTCIHIYRTTLSCLPPPLFALPRQPSSLLIFLLPSSVCVCVYTCTCARAHVCPNEFHRGFQEQGCLQEYVVSTLKKRSLPLPSAPDCAQAFREEWGRGGMSWAGFNVHCPPPEFLRTLS